MLVVSNDSILGPTKEVIIQEEYTGTLLEDGHISIPKEIIDKLKVYRGSKLHVTVAVEKEIPKDKIPSYAGLLSDLTEEERRRFDETVKRRIFFGSRKAEIWTDILMAAIAIDEDLIFITNNTGHFKRIKELKMDNWLA